MTRFSSGIETPLLPCPWCGLTPTLTAYNGRYDKESYCVHCKECDLSLDGDATPAEAVARWNTRVAPPHLSADISDAASIAILGVQEVADAWGVLESHGFPPESVNWPEENIAGKLPIAIDNALTAIIGARDDLLAEVLRLRALAQSAWRPIETAPKDGTEILGWWCRGRTHAIISWSSDGWWMDRADGGMVNTPTNWQPLQDGPSLPSTHQPCPGCDGHECDEGCAYPGAISSHNHETK